jgi:integrase
LILIARTRRDGRGGSTKCCPTRRRSASGAATTRPCPTPTSPPSWRLAETPGVAAKALAFTILTAARSGEVLNATWDEIDLATATWSVPGSRMKTQKSHAVPLSDAAVAILLAQEAVRGKSPYIFPGGRPSKPLSTMAMAAVIKRMGVDGDWTIHGMRSAARSWMADNGVPFEVAEACLAHAVGNAVVQAYQRSSMLERRRPVMGAWASFLTGEAEAKKGKKVVPISEGRTRKRS